MFFVVAFFDAIFADCLSRVCHPNFAKEAHLSSFQNLGWLGYIRDDIPTQLYWDYFISYDIRIPSLTNQDSIMAGQPTPP